MENVYVPVEVIPHVVFKVQENRSINVTLVSPRPLLHFVDFSELRISFQKP